MYRIVILILLPGTTFSQLGEYSPGFLNEIFFGRQPSARAEAMGRSYVAMDGDFNTTFYNPAGSATIKGVESDYTTASPYYGLMDANYYFSSMAYSIRDKLTIGISENEIVPETPYNDTTRYWNPDYNYSRISNYSFNISNQSKNNFLIGFNFNYLELRSKINYPGAFYIDVGIIKKLILMKQKNNSHLLNLGLSLKNCINERINFLTGLSKQNRNLPMITRVGATYQFNLNKNIFFDTLRTYQIILNGEYQFLLNSKYNSGVHLGAEFTFLEIISFRAGYYQEKQYSYDINHNKLDKIGGLTYGLGVQLPLNKLTKIPLNFYFDYINLPQVSYTKTDNWNNFTTLNFRTNWVVKYSQRKPNSNK